MQLLKPSLNMNKERMFFIIGTLILVRVVLLLFFVIIDGDFMERDSLMYITIADNLLEHQLFSASVLPPFEPDFFRTPGYPVFLATLKFLGVTNLYGVVFAQELIYCLCLWLFYRFGLPLFGKKITYISLLFLLLEPAGFTNSKLILSETLFLPFVYLGLFLIGFYLKKTNWRYLLISGFVIGLGVMVRPALFYISIIICFVLIAFDFRNKQRWLHTGLLLFTISLTISPWIIRNQQYSDGFFISGQASNMFANYHVPEIWEYTKGTSELEGKKIIASQVKASIQEQEQRQGYELSTIDKFRVQQSLALKELSKYPFEYFKQWIVGSLNTMMGTQTKGFYKIFKIKNESVGYKEIKGLNFLSTTWVYLKSQSFVNISHVFLRAMITLFALIGALAIIFKHKDCFLWIIMLTSFYYMFIPGPMGYGRFRFPIDVFWFVQACYGFLWVASNPKIIKISRSFSNFFTKESHLF